MPTYFKNVDFLKFLLCMGIILRHIHNCIASKPEFANIGLYSNIINNNNGNIPVDCFFIISGFFLFYKTDFMMNIYSFMKKKLIRLLPVIYFALIIQIFVSSLIKHCINIPINEVWTIFLLQNVGFTNEFSVLANTWYVSVLFWISCLYFYVYKISNKKVFNLIMVLMVFLGYSIYFHVGTKSPITSIHFINHGLIRGVAGMSLGYVIYRLYDDLIKNNRTTLFSSAILCTLLEFILIGFILFNIFYKQMCYSNHLLIIFSFTILFVLFIANKGLLSKILDNNFSRIMGRYTYSIYITHVLIRNLWISCIYKICPNFVLNHSILNITIIYISAILLGILTYHMVEKPGKSLGTILRR